MKIDTRLGKATKIGYTTESRTDAPVNASSRIPQDFVINPNAGVTPMDTFATSQDPMISFARGFCRGIGKVLKVMCLSLGFIIPFWLVISLWP